MQLLSFYSESFTVFFFWGATKMCWPRQIENQRIPTWRTRFGLQRNLSHKLVPCEMDVAADRSGVMDAPRLRVSVEMTAASRPPALRACPPPPPRGGKGPGPGASLQGKRFLETPSLQDPGLVIWEKRARGPFRCFGSQILLSSNAPPTNQPPLSLFHRGRNMLRGTN